MAERSKCRNILNNALIVTILVANLALTIVAYYAAPWISVRRWLTGRNSSGQYEYNECFLSNFPGDLERLISFYELDQNSTNVTVLKTERHGEYDLYFKGIRSGSMYET